MLSEFDQAPGAEWPLLDFMSYEGVAAEEAPPDDDRKTRMTHWIEPGHFRPAVGAAMFGRLREPAASSDFGSIVAAQDIGVRNTALDAQQRAWQEANPSQRVRLDRWLGLR
jgi:hypothetical protein